MAATVTININPNAVDEIIDLVTSAIDKGADRMVSVAAGIAPRDTGALSKSIHKEQGDSPGEVFVIANPKQARAPNGYAIFPELGTARNPAQPYMFPALKAVIPTIVSELQR